MTKREIFAVASKILGIYLLVRALESTATIGYFIAALRKADDVSFYLFGGVIPFLLYLAVGFCLIKWAEPIAAKLSGKEEASVAEGALEKDALQAIAFSAVGVFIIAAALPRITQIIVNLSVQGPMRPEVVLRTWGTIVGFVLQLGIGIYLFFGSKGLVGLLKKIKSI